MRYAAVAVAASLLVKDVVLAGTLPGHRRVHDRRAVVTVTAEDIVYATEIVTVTVDWDAAQAAATTPSTTPVSTPVVATTPVVVKASTSSTPVPVVLPSTSALQIAVVVKQSTSNAATTLATSVKPAPTTSTTPAAKSSTTSSAAAKVSSSSSSSTGKRGLPYNSASLTTPFSGNSKITWAYNWASTSDGLSSAFEFVPMLWGLSSTFTNAWTKNADAAIAAGSTHLVAFNEPDLAAQANIGYADAAAGYLKYMNPYAGKAKLGSPSVTNGASPMGLTYLKNFMTSCSTCQIDFCTIHWYDSATNIAYFKEYMAQAYTACNNKPIWLTEFGATGTDAEIVTFFQTVLPWLDAQSYVERYAYFMAADNMLVSGTAMSTIGKAYAA